MNAKRREAIGKIISELQGLSAALSEIASEEQDFYDNMPENMQGSEKGERASEVAGTLQEATDEIDTIIGNLEDTTS
jgi:hypothetical protein